MLVDFVIKPSILFGMLVLASTRCFTRCRSATFIFAVVFFSS